jgi:hypothetical protein
LLDKGTLIETRHSRSAQGLAHKYVLDEYEFYDGVEWFNGECGDCRTTLLNNGLVLSAYAKYLAKGTSLILWKPATS